MRFSKKHVLVTFSSLLLAMLVGCTSGGDPSPSNGERESTDPGLSGDSATINETGFPIVDEPVEIKMFAQRSAPNGAFNDMLTFVEYEKMTNVKVTFEDVPSEGFQERKNLLFASNELPDAFFKSGITPLEAVRYGMNGMLTPHEELIEQYAPNLSKLLEEYPAIRASITAPDGHIYAIPGIVTLNAGRTTKHWINSTWLEDLDLAIPETTDELIEVLRKFRDEQKGIPMSAWDLNGLIVDMSGSFGLTHQLGYRVNIEDGKVNIWHDDERYLEFLQFMRQLYEENLIDPEFLTHTSSQYVGKMSAGNVGFFFNQASDPFTVHEEHYLGIAPVAGPRGDRIARSGPIARDFGAFAITSANRHPEVTMRWIDYFYGEEGSEFLRYGIEGETFYYQENGWPEYTDAIYNDDRGTGPTIGQFSPFPGGGAPHLIEERNASAINPQIVQDAQEQMDPYILQEVYGAPLFNEDTIRRVNTIKDDIDTYVEEAAAQFVTGAIGFDQWDQYVQTLQQMNLSELEEIYQSALELMK